MWEGEFDSLMMLKSQQMIKMLPNVELTYLKCLFLICHSLEVMVIREKTSIFHLHIHFMLLMINIIICRVSLMNCLSLRTVCVLLWTVVVFSRHICIFQCVPVFLMSLHTCSHTFQCVLVCGQVCYGWCLLPEADHYPLPSVLFLPLSPPVWKLCGHPLDCLTAEACRTLLSSYPSVLLIFFPSL